MEIGSNQAFGGPGSLAPTSETTPGKSASGQAFGSFLKTQGVAASNMSASTENSSSASSVLDEDDIAFIRENGFQAYVLERNHERKLEEMREKILSGMGLNDEALAAMPKQQRELIEKMIAEEIQARLAAEAELNRGSEPAEKTATAGGHNAPTQAVFPDLSGRMQAMVGFSIVDAVTGSAHRAGKEDNRQQLPTGD